MKIKTRILNIRIGEADQKRINELQERLQMSKTDVVLTAIARLHGQIVR